MQRKMLFNAIRKVMIVIPYTLLYSFSDIILGGARDSTLSDKLWYAIFGRLTSEEVQTLVLTFESVGGIFLFCLLFGDYISRIFNSIDKLFFTRVPSRKAWMVRQAVFLYGAASLYVFIVICLKLAVAKWQSPDLDLNSDTLFTITVIWFLLSTLITVLCLIVNWLSIEHGLPIGMISAFAVTIILEFIAIFHFESPVNMVLNPMCFNIRIIHDAGIAAVKILNDFGYTVVVIWGMCFYIHRKDIY